MKKLRIKLHGFFENSGDCRGHIWVYHLGWELSQLSFGAVEVGLLDTREFGCCHVTAGWVIDCWVLKVLCFSSWPLLVCCFTGALRCRPSGWAGMCRPLGSLQHSVTGDFSLKGGFGFCSLGFGVFLFVYFTLAKASNLLFFKENKLFKNMAILWKASEVLRFRAYFWWPIWPETPCSSINRIGFYATCQKE